MRHRRGCRNPRGPRVASLTDDRFIGIKAFAAAIVGGFGSLPGAILGGLIVGIAEQFAGLYGSTGSADITAYVIILLMLFVRPEACLQPSSGRRSDAFHLQDRYQQDIAIFKHDGQRFWYGIWRSPYCWRRSVWIPSTWGNSPSSYIYAIAGIGLMLLVGYTGLVSLGHAAFLAIGAYAHAILMTNGLPFPMSLILASLVAR